MPTGMASSRRPSLRAHLKPHHKLWLDWDGAFLMGPRYLPFLDAVDRTGTIRAAGREVGWSYRTCLNRMREMGRVLGAKVRATPRGGSSRGGARLQAIGDSAGSLLRRVRFGAQGNLAPWAS